jgi:4-amino-4-deoxy-L-arabinose transferase-like glycosyltransferase
MTIRETGNGESEKLFGCVQDFRGTPSHLTPPPTPSPLRGGEERGQGERRGFCKVAQNSGRTQLFPFPLPPSPFYHLLLLSAILLFAAAVRFQGVTWGLPYQLHPDEPVVFLAARHLRQTGTLEGLPFQEVYQTAIGYPPLYIRWLVAQQAALNFLGRTLEAQQMLFFAFARILNVLTGTAIVALVYRLTSDVADRDAAALAAAFVAADPTLIDHARFATPDTPVTALILLTLLLALKAHKGRSPWLGQGAVACGLLAVATKYHAAPLLAIALYVLAKSQWKNPRRLILHLALAVLLIACVFGLLLTRFHMLELFQAPGQPTKSLFTKENPLALIGLQGNLGALVSSVGWLHLAFALLGLLLLLRATLSRRASHVAARAWLVVAFAVLFILQLSLFRFDNIRQLLPVIAIVGLFWGCGVRYLAELLARYAARRPDWATAIAAFMAVALLAPQAVFAVQSGWRLTHKDTRAITADWFIANAPDGAGIAVEYDHVEFVPQYGGFPGDKRFKVIQVDSLFDLTRDEYLGAGIQYLVADSRAAKRGGYFSDPDNPEFRRWTRRLLEIPAEGRPGPRRIILKIE